MDRGFDIPWVGDKIISMGDQNTMGRVSIFHGYGGVKIPWVGVSQYHGWIRYTMDRGINIPWIMGSIYHG